MNPMKVMLFGLMAPFIFGLPVAIITGGDMFGFGFGLFVCIFSMIATFIMLIMEC